MDRTFMTMGVLFLKKILHSNTTSYETPQRKSSSIKSTNEVTIKFVQHHKTEETLH